MTASLPLIGGCLLAAAGVGAGGGIYFTERGAESVLPVSLERATTGTERTFDELRVRPTKTATDEEAGTARRELDGTVRDRDVSVTLKAEGSTHATRVFVVAKTNAVTWDKDFARTILDKIVAYSR